MTARPRCPRGHFLPAPGEPCRCQQYARSPRLPADLHGQRIPADARITTIHLTGDRL
ncbi:hypothetical protein [Streptomyces sp. NPDC014806]|uniref:hypothetical protein n=1 Tax=Streptomyces sp. NPDC014806 TaxID=3364920 RepID=UPI0037004C9E